MREERADVCVIGCGPAGAIVASSLAAAGRNVLVLERGNRFSLADRGRVLERLARLEPAKIEDGERPEQQSQYSSPEVDGRTYQARLGAGVGGATLHWFGYAPRPREDDLSTRSRYGYGRDWPITYAELEPWLLAAEHELGTAAAQDNPYASPRSGPFPMAAHATSYFEREILGPAYRRLAWTPHSHPIAINSTPYDGRAACQACRFCEACPSGAKFSADLVHVPRLLAAGGRVLDGIHVTRIETANDGGRVVAVHAVTVQDRQPLVIRAETFVVAGGGVETPRLLLLSRRGSGKVAPGLAAESLGRGFMDHGICYYEMTLRKPVGTALGFPTIGCDHFRRDVDRRKHSTFHWVLGPSYRADSVVEKFLGTGVFHPSRIRDELRRRVAGIVTFEVEPSGTLDLDPSSLDAYGDPIARIRLPLTNRDRATAAATVKPLQELTQALEAEETLVAGWDSGAWHFGSHPMGGCAMGRSPDEGVCDASLRVFGVDNLFVVSSAVFPHFGSANPTLTIAALALRLAAQLGGRAASVRQ
jgi:glucose dehydrogenase